MCHPTDGWVSCYCSREERNFSMCWLPQASGGFGISVLVPHLHLQQAPGLNAVEHEPYMLACIGLRARPPDGSKSKDSACTNSLHSSITRNLLWQEESEENKTKKNPRLWRESKITESPAPSLSKLLLRQLGIQSHQSVGSLQSVLSSDGVLLPLLLQTW